METNIHKLKQIQQNMEQISPYFTRVDSLLAEIDTHAATGEQIAALFNLHNEMFPQIKEFSTFCDKCRSRVYNRIYRWYEGQLDLVKQEEQSKPKDGTESIVDPVVQDTEEPPKPKRGRKKKAEADPQSGVSE